MSRLNRSEQRQLLSTLLSSSVGYHNLILYLQNDLAEDVEAFNAAANNSVFADDNIKARLQAARRFGRAEARQELLNELMELTKGSH